MDMDTMDTTTTVTIMDTITGTITGTAAVLPFTPQM
jgi:hypothetical protein